MTQSFSLAGTSLANELSRIGTGTGTGTGVSTSQIRSNLPRNSGTYIDERALHTGYLFACPGPVTSPDCKLLHKLKKNPGPEAFATEIMDHIRLTRHDMHLNGKPLSPDEKAAISTQIDPWGQNWVRSGDNRALFLAGGLTNLFGYALLYFPDADSNGEKGDWDIVDLQPAHPLEGLGKPTLQLSQNVLSH